MGVSASINTFMSTLSLPSDTFNLFPASPTNHVIQFGRMPMTTFLVQEVNLPAVSGTIARVATPGAITRHVSDKLTYDPLTVTFMLDEEFRAWRELYAWLLGMSGGYDRSVLVADFIQQHFEYTDIDPKYRHANASRTTAGLTIINPAKIPMLRFIFHNLYITSLGDVRFDTKATDTITPLTCSATFEYDYYSQVQIRR